MGNMKTKYAAVALGPNAIEEAARLGGYSVEDATKISELADEIYDEISHRDGMQPFHLFNAALNIITRMVLEAKPQNQIALVSAVTECLVAIIGGHNDGNVVLMPEDEQTRDLP